MVLNVQYEIVLVLNNEESQLHAPLQCWKIIENANAFMGAKINSTWQGLTQCICTNSKMCKKCNMCLLIVFLQVWRVIPVAASWACCGHTMPQCWVSEVHPSVSSVSTTVSWSRCPGKHSSLMSMPSNSWSRLVKKHVMIHIADSSVKLSRQP